MVLRRNLWLIAAVAAAAVGVVALWSSREAPRYWSSATIRLVDPPPGMLEVTDGAVLGRVVDREGLRVFSASSGEPAGFLEDAQVTLPPDRTGAIRLEFEAGRIAYGPPQERRTAAYGETIRLSGLRFTVPSRPRGSPTSLSVVPRAAAIAYLAGHLEVVSDPASGGIEVRFTSGEPRIVPRTVNAVAEAYRELSLLRVDTEMGRRRASLEAQLREADSLLLAAQTELGLLRSREQQAELRGALEAQLGVYESVLDRVLRARTSDGARELVAPRSLPDIAADPVVGPLYARLYDYRSERAGLLSGPSARSPEHPDVQRLSALIASIEGDLVAAIGARLGTLRGQIGVLGGVGEAPVEGAREADLARDIAERQRVAAELRAEVQAARLAEVSKAAPVEIVEPSTRALPVPSGAWPQLLFGLGVGLVLGASAAFAREAVEGRVRARRERRREAEAREATEDRVQEGIETGKGELVPNLAVIPRVTPSLVEPISNGDFRPGPLQAAGLEAYRLLRTRLLASRWGLKTLVVTSAHPGEGKTTTSTNLAATYARQGLKVVLVECDFRRPSLGRYFGNTKEIDLMDVLFEDRDWRHAIQLTKMPGLYVLLGEKSFPRSGESLGGPEMRRLLAELSHEYDLVILDTSPLLVAADAIALSPIVDGVLIVVRAASTDSGTLEEVVERLSLAGASIVGTVLNDPEGAPTS